MTNSFFHETLHVSIRNITRGCSIMKLAAYFFVFIVAVLHFGFLALEMFLWQKPLGLKIFRNSPKKAETTAVLAANQGLYNGFLASGLLTSFFFSAPDTTLSFQVYFLSCVILAGLYGAWSLNRRIFFVQAFPAILALIFVLATSSQI
jgi:putative membrane protein